MKYFISMFFLFSLLSSHLIFDFNKRADVQDWIIVDDVVMGGRSSGTFKLDDEGYGVFAGNISLENNGGFSSVRYSFPRTPVAGYSKVVIRLKGDGKEYQFRVKANAGDYFSYIAPFSTTGEWQEIEIPLQDMYPSFRGRRLNRPNFSGDHIEQITFLIGNKKKEQFKLLIDKIELR